MLGFHIAEVLAWVPGEPIVPEGWIHGAPYLQLCDLLQLANNLIQFTVYLSVLIATIMFVYAGILYVTGSADQNNIEKAKKVFWSVFWGLVIVLSAWLVVDVILSVLTDKGGLAPWSQIQCTGGRAPADTTSQQGDIKNPPTTISQANEQNVQNQLIGCGAPPERLNACPVSTVAGVVQRGCTSVSGLQPNTIASVCALAKSCKDASGTKGCQISITGGSENHSEKTLGAPGTHSGGDKVDIKATDTFKAYVANQVRSGKFEEVKSPSFGTKQYRDKATGAVLTLEDEGTPNEHYDYCSQNCGGGGD